MRRAAAVCAVLILLFSLLSGCAEPDFVEEVVLTPEPTALEEVQRLVELTIGEVPEDTPGSFPRKLQILCNLLRNLEKEGRSGKMLTEPDKRFLPIVTICEENVEYVREEALVVEMDNGDLICYLDCVRETEELREAAQKEAEAREMDWEFVLSHDYEIGDRVHYLIIAEDTEIYSGYLDRRVIYDPSAPN